MLQKNTLPQGSSAVMKKLKKLCSTPGLFFRDFFNKRYPAVNCEQSYTEFDESIILKTFQNLTQLDSQLLSLSKSKQIDIVYTWVDNQDTHWQEKYHFYKSIVSPTSLGLYACDHARFDNHNELFFSINGVLKFLPWVRKIFIVTDNQKPDWFVEDERICIIDHKEIIDKKYLPTFNSHVIEAHLHKIPGLSENFIYFNDDVFVARPLDAEHFFRSNNLASIFVAKKSLSQMISRGVMTPTLHASINSNKILERGYGINVAWTKT